MKFCETFSEIAIIFREKVRDNFEKIFEKILGTFSKKF